MNQWTFNREAIDRMVLFSPLSSAMGLGTVILLVLLSIAALTYYTCRTPRKYHDSLLSHPDRMGKKLYINELLSTSYTHKKERALQALIRTDGALDWPPRASHGASWPVPLRPYHTVLNEMLQLLVYPGYSSDDNNTKHSRCIKFRETMKSRLRESINLTAVEELLSRGEDWSVLSPDDCNGLFTCISFCRHAYRWGSSPVVRVMQEEKIIELPQELEVPWTFLRRRYGITSLGGNLTSNFLHNMTKDGKLAYSITHGDAEIIRTTEYYFTKVVAEMEGLALPMYFHIVKSIVAYDAGDHQSCIQSLQIIRESLRKALQVYYDTFISEKVNEKVWGTHIQGFHGWAAGVVADGKYVEYDGVSGSHTLYIIVIDAFLGMVEYETIEETMRHIPRLQRDFIFSVRKNSFRHRATQGQAPEVEKSMSNIIKIMKIFRTSHRRRARTYLTVPTPERMIMTAGNSVLENEQRRTREAAVGHLDAFLAERLEQTR